MSSHRIHSAGKGDSYRPVDKKVYDENYDRIFGKRHRKKPSTSKNSKPKKETS